VHERRFDILGPEALASRDTKPLFAYGTLQVPLVLDTLLGRVPDSVPGRVTGWRAAALPHRPYPGLVRSAGQMTCGRILTGITPHEWLLLDRFEDQGYELTPITTDPEHTVWAYTWPHEALPREWMLDAFIATHLSSYIDRCHAWLTCDRARHTAPDAEPAPPALPSRLTTPRRSSTALRSGNLIQREPFEPRTGVRPGGPAHRTSQ
jgi:gamma-glutamylcyclotransferase (GGCT)/AIG2-like uncharacterized protein YtfP